MPKVRATRVCFCGQKLREVGEVFDHEGQLYDWLEVIKDGEPNEKSSDRPKPKVQKGQRPERDEDVI